MKALVRILTSLLYVRMARLLRQELTNPGRLGGVRFEDHLAGCQVVTSMPQASVKNSSSERIRERDGLHLGLADGHGGLRQDEHKQSGDA
jgi:hypothetical protein